MSELVEDGDEIVAIRVIDIDEDGESYTVTLAFSLTTSQNEPSLIIRTNSERTLITFSATFWKRTTRLRTEG
jgi:hypothetical protein